VKNVGQFLFFENIEKWKNFKLCEKCAPESSNINSKEIYICKNCSNKKLCKNCADNHNFNDEVIKIDKFDSTCQIHLSQYFGYCDNCKENICMFCQSENHQNHSIILLSNILIPKNQLDFFKKI
jgi:hypothetical protein